jgi:nonribosomal peptide synthetase DhbF
MTLFAARRDPVEHGLNARAWEPYVTGRIEEHAVNCHHGEMTQPGPLAQIGAVIAGRLRSAE